MMQLSEAIEAYRLSLLARGDTTQHVETTVRRVQKVLQLGQITQVAELREMAVMAAAARLRCRLAPVTINHHLRAVRSFSTFMVRNDVLARDPLVAVRPVPVRGDLRHPRRALSVDEARRLIGSAEAAADLWAQERALVYETALLSGLRAGELRGIEARDLGERSIRVRASISKNRRETHQPIPRHLAEKLRRITTDPDSPIFPSMPHPCTIVRVLRRDLMRASIAYQTHEGIADFHSLRHTYLTWLTASSGLDPRTAQLLARHSTISLTYNLYAHRASGELIRAVDGLPVLRRTSTAMGRAGIEPATHGFSVHCSTS